MKVSMENHNEGHT